MRIASLLPPCHFASPYEWKNIVTSGRKEVTLVWIMLVTAPPQEMSW